MAEKKLKRASFVLSDKKKIIAQFSEYKGKDYLNVRTFVTKNGEDQIPTPAGFNIGTTKEELDKALVFFQKVVTLIKQKRGDE